MWIVRFRWLSALPVATFLVSNTAHPIADLRWLLDTAHVGGPRVSKAVEAARAIVCGLTFLVPPQMLVVCGAKETRLPAARFVLEWMHPDCWGGSLLFYVTHVIIRSLSHRGLCATGGKRWKGRVCRRRRREFSGLPSFLKF